ncbi:MAG TPA: DUF4070 domain-containing protein [Pirellulales bacterium]|nr:DUF4070 domain-containing protein [Pirellulales bacterium]
MANIVLINPRFEVSYWGLEYALPLIRRRANLPTACLPLLAALTPPEHHITLVDENVEPIDFDLLARADLVGVTGMSVQRNRMREILTELKDRKIFTAVGGPWVTVREDYFGDLADVIFVGEAEETWPRFLIDWQAGEHRHRYEQAAKTDMTRVPAPRYDLLKMQHYMFGSLQISRGCPFQCEFCDIIVTFGRRPRLKTSDQVIQELDNLNAQGMESAFIVDDNLIGNKQAIKPVLRRVAQWQQDHDYAINFFTEASLDMADDAELMQLMVDANVSSVFVGIESPNEASLRETKKFQNVRTGGTIVEKVHRIQKAGLDVWCGMILGFDHDDTSVFNAHYRFLHDARIVQAMVGMLAAIPKTPLYDRLATEGRLGNDDEAEFGTNVVPVQMTRAELRDGYVQLLQQLQEPESYFGRLDALFLDPEFQPGKTRDRYWRRHRWAWLRAKGWHLLRAGGIYLELMAMVPDKQLRREYRRRIARLVRKRPDPVLAFVYLIKCAIHYHVHTMTKQMASRSAHVVNSF